MSRTARWRGTALHRLVGVGLRMAILFLRLLEVLLGGGLETSLRRTRLGRALVVAPYLWMRQRINAARARTSAFPTTSNAP